MGKPNDFDFQFYRLLNGDFPDAHCLRVGEIPRSVASKMGWSSRSVFLSGSDAKKIRFHPQHGMKAMGAVKIVETLVGGDYYRLGRGGEHQIEVVYHNPLRVKEIHFAALAHDPISGSIHFRTFYRTTNMSRGKFNGATRLHWSSGVNYFFGSV